MSAYAQTRPGTPYPTTDSISYFPQTTPRRMSQSIHFPLPSRPVLTPPSLLHRTSSSGSSSSSSFHLSKTPSFGHGRRSSTCSSSSSSAGECSSMPVTPTVIPEVDEDVMEIMDSNFELHEPSFIKSSLPKSPKTSDFTSVPFNMILPSRPKLKRRDTPRPKADVFFMAPLPRRQMPTLSPVDETMPKRKLTSMIDGKSWIVLA